MKFKSILTICAFALTLTLTHSAMAVDAPPPQKSELFRADELTLDLAGTYTAAEPNGFGHVFNTDARGGTYGIAGGATYWIKRNVGIGFEAGINDVHRVEDHVLDYTTLTLNIRVPIGRIAPYGVFGLGRDFNNGQYNCQAGAGIEWRFATHLSAFGDVRFIFTARRQQDAALFRAGARLVF